MSILTVVRPVVAARQTAEVATAAVTKPRRWGSLDVLRGVALWAMIAHHFARWTGGDTVGERFIGFEHFVVTDLAAPAFAVGCGAAALVVGSRIRDWSGLKRPLRRWGEVLLAGIALDLVVDASLDGGGVLPTLAVLGCAVMLTVAAGLRRPGAWWLLSLACTFAAVPAIALGGDGIGDRFLNGPFSLPVYGVFAAAGAAVAAHALGRPERALPLWRATVGIVAAGLVLDLLAGGVVAPDGLWPPARHPGYLAFTLWGLAATLLLWALLRSLVPSDSALGAAAARAGRRTLSIFLGHYMVKLVLVHVGAFNHLDTWRWGLATWGAVAFACLITALPSPIPWPTLRTLRSGISGPPR